MATLIAQPWFAVLIEGGPAVLFFAIAVIAGGIYCRPACMQIRSYWFMRLAIVAIILRVAIAIGKTVVQYYAWLGSDAGRFLLPPHQSIAVLLRYGWTHFGLNAAISIGFAVLFLLVLRSLRTYNARYFDDGEVELGFVMALVVGWPAFIVFVPAVFLSVIIVSIVRGVFYRQPYTTLGVPFLGGCVIALVVSGYLIDMLKLTSWVI